MINSDLPTALQNVVGSTHSEKERFYQILERFPSKMVPVKTNAY